MSKFWAKVKFKQEKNAEHLIKTFFQNFNPASSIVARGKEAKLEIVFQDPPMAIIDAINHCEVIELNYGKNLKEYEEDETFLVEKENDSEQKNAGGESFEKSEQEVTESENSEQSEQELAESENSEQSEQEVTESENSEQSEQEVAESENSEQSEQEVTESKNSEQTKQKVAEVESSKQTDQSKKKIGKPTTKMVKPMKKSKDDNISIPELEEIAKKSTSFEHFAKSVAEWLEMKKQQELFTNFIIVSSTVDTITWKEIEKALHMKNIFYKPYDKITCSQKISKKLKDYSITILSFLKITSQYKEYSFNQVDEHSTEENSNEQATEKTMKNVEEKAVEFDESVIPKPRVKMECMPEIKDFEETLASVDKTQPVEERVRYVLGAMGLNNMPAKEQKQIVEIASTAVKKERISFDIIFVEANIPIEQTMSARMTFSKFVNDFVQKYESGKKVKLLTFLSELQKIIMFENEIESFSDFTE